jgi:5-methylcytosine-specific restriction endonuclease McrA
MRTDTLARANELLEKTNADLEPELLSAEATRSQLALYARAEKLAAYGKTMLARKLDDAAELARTTGVSIAKAKATVDTAKALGEADAVRDAFRAGDVSWDQAAEIARAERATPGSASELLEVASRETLQVLRERARKIFLEAEQYRGLAERQHKARSARSHSDELGMVHLHVAWEPHVGTPIVNRAEAEAARRYREAKKEDRLEPFERFLADAYAGMLSGAPTKRSRRPELVVLVSHEVTQRGWTDVRKGETCKIPGVGPVAPEVAKQIASDAFLTGVFFDGKDLRHLRRWTRNIPIEVFTALELGEPPEFDGIKCVDCGKRFRTQNDHVEPHNVYGPASTDNLEPRCWSCHKAKTERDRRAGKLSPWPNPHVQLDDEPPDEERGPPGDERLGRGKLVMSQRLRGVPRPRPVRWEATMTRRESWSLPDTAGGIQRGAFNL